MALKRFLAKPLCVTCYKTGQPKTDLEQVTLNFSNEV